MASDYGNLGAIYQTRGDLDEAERLIRKALEISEKLGRLEGVAIAYANLGLVMATRARPNEAREAWEMSIDRFVRLGAISMVQRVQTWIDQITTESATDDKPPAKGVP
jgi:tetratricopeptide (TPR) repeat protein